MGIVHSIIYKSGQHPPNLPIAVLVNFECYHGPGFVNEDKVVPIVPIISMSNSTDNMERQQLAYVAISRVRKLSDLIIIPTTHDGKKKNV